MVSRKDTTMKHSIIARALFIAAAALFIFLMLGTIARIVQPSSWTMETLLLAAFLLVASGGFVAYNRRLKR
jgi:hypothetical protein